MRASLPVAGRRPAAGAPAAGAGLPNNPLCAMESIDDLPLLDDADAPAPADASAEALAATDQKRC